MSMPVMCREFLQDEFFNTLQTSIPNFLLANSHLLILMTINANGLRPKYVSHTALCTVYS